MGLLPHPGSVGGVGGTRAASLAPVFPPIPLAPALLSLPGDIMLCRGGPSPPRGQPLFSC